MGATEAMTAGPLCTVKPLFSVATSVPVVMVTVCGPVAAVGEMLMLAMAWVASVTVSVLTVIPLPKLAVVAGAVEEKWVKAPVMATFRFACPCGPELGEALKTTAVPACTVKPLARVATSPPVVSVTAFVPVGAVAEW